MTTCERHKEGSTYDGNETYRKDCAFCAIEKTQKEAVKEVLEDSCIGNEIIPVKIKEIKQERDL